MTLFIAAISLGLLSSFHCLGMCGPIAFILPVNNRSTIGKVFGLLTYNLGRIISYSILGLLVGFFGEGLRFAGVSQLISVVLGLVLILYVILSKKLFKTQIHNKYYIKLNNYLKGKLKNHLKKQSNLALWVTGLLNGFIPCGAVFIALQASLLQSTILESIFFMFVFGLGTIPMMFAISYLSNSFGSKFKFRINKVMPVITIVVALLLIVRGMNLNIPYISPSYDVEKNEISCCHKPE